MAKVLIGGPIHFYKIYSMSNYLSHIRAMQIYSKHEIDVLLSDNSPDMHFIEHIHKEIDPEVEILWLKNAPFGSPNSVHLRLVECRNMLRQRAIDGNYDYFLSLECDVYAPKNTVDVMISDLPNNNSVISGLYYKRFFKDEFTSGRTPNLSNGVGVLGLTLIPRNIFSKITFRHPGKKLGAFDDAYFYQDLDRDGYSHYITPNVVAKHDRRCGPEYAILQETGISKAELINKHMSRRAKRSRKAKRKPSGAVKLIQQYLDELKDLPNAKEAPE